jgi:hypothetical protein
MTPQGIKTLLIKDTPSDAEMICRARVGTHSTCTG